MGGLGYLVSGYSCSEAKLEMRRRGRLLRFVLQLVFGKIIGVVIPSILYDSFIIVINICFLKLIFVDS